MQVQFDPLQDFSSPASQRDAATAPSVLCCSDDGLLSQCIFTSEAKPLMHQIAHTASRSLFSRPHCVTSFDVEAVQGQDLIAVTEGQEVVFFRR